MCNHLVGVPLLPEVAQDLARVSLVKGAQASTAIEGNTLSADEVAGILDGTYSAPPSLAYQEQEVRNVLDALQAIVKDVREGTRLVITAELICEYNRRVLEATDHSEEVVPGAIRQRSAVVGGYRGAPAEDCGYLLGRLAEWLEGETFQSDEPEVQFALHLAAAVCAHLYINWIHPFGDGNGRTARLLEFTILARSGVVSLPAAHLLSNHYNLTRGRYYRELQTADRTGSIVGFLGYAIDGFVDGLRGQIELVHGQQLRIAWINYVNEVMGGFSASAARDRQRALVLAMPPGEVVAQGDLKHLSTEVSATYAGVSTKTFRRDLNRLKSAELLINDGDSWKANVRVLTAFMPPAPGDRER